MNGTRPAPAFARGGADDFTLQGDGTDIINYALPQTCASGPGGDPCWLAMANASAVASIAPVVAACVPVWAGGATCTESCKTALVAAFDASGCCMRGLIGGFFARSNGTLPDDIAAAVVAAGSAVPDRDALRSIINDGLNACGIDSTCAANATLPPIKIRIPGVNFPWIAGSPRARANFTRALALDLAAAAGMDPSEVVIHSLTAGSVIAEVSAQSVASSAVADASLEVLASAAASGTLSLSYTSAAVLVGGSAAVADPAVVSAAGLTTDTTYSSSSSSSTPVQSSAAFGTPAASAGVALLAVFATLALATMGRA